jgi:hypothetical protein
MKRYKFHLIVLIFFLSINSLIFAQLEIIQAFPNLTFEQIVDIQSPGDNTNRIFVVSQPGIIRVFENDESVIETKDFLDIRSKVLYGGEQGLLGLAFHPNFVNNGYFFVNYTTNNPRRTVISRFSIDTDDINKADITSEIILMEVDQPYSNHNGGQLVFGPDGYLYNSFGDGGSGGDPMNNGQNRSTLLASIIRIDVDRTQGDLNYAIPPGNPFVGNSEGYREEIYAYGLRNVWRFSFDNDGRLWAADVGQNAWEEVHIINKGDNCGWRVMEGFHCYNPASGCDQTGLSLPIWEYEHNSSGGFSITGGYVSYSLNAEEIFGKYICADFVSGRFWALTYENGNLEVEVLAETSFPVSTFGTDKNGELYFASYRNDGRIYKFSGTKITGVEPNIPGDYKLHQNYPNPFNPSTNIKIEIQKSAFVTLDIYDVLGKPVDTLVNEYKSPGIYNYKFNAQNLATGIYYYRLKTGEFSESKKMLFLK